MRERAELHSVIASVRSPLLDVRVVYCHCEYMSTTKDDRLQIRVAPDRKRVLEEAAETSHLSVSAFVLQAAEMRADEVLLDRDAVRLSSSAAKAFADALDRRAEVSERLASALRRPRKFAWLD